MKVWLMRANLFLESPEKAATDAKAVVLAVAEAEKKEAESEKEKKAAEDLTRVVTEIDLPKMVKAEAVVETDSEDHVVEEEVELDSQVVISSLQLKAESMSEVAEADSEVDSEVTEAETEVEAEVDSEATEVAREEKRAPIPDLQLDPDNTKDTTHREVAVLAQEVAAAEVALDLPTDPSENYLLNF